MIKIQIWVYQHCIFLMKTLISVEVELSDENGNVKYLRENPQRFANETLMERETLVLLQVNREYK